MESIESLKLEIRDYTLAKFDKIFVRFILILLAFGLLMIIIEPNEKVIGRLSILSGVFSIFIWYFYTFFFHYPKIEGIIEIGNDKISFKGQDLPTDEIEYISINYKNYRGKIVLKRTEYPLPQFGINNEIKIQLKSGIIYSSNFFVKRKKDRKKIDRFVDIWINKNIRTQYIIDNELIASNIN